MRLRELCYQEPAKSWYEALPLGSGRLGAMVFGGIEKERIGLNLDTFWSGDGKRDKYPKKSINLEKLRTWIAEGEHAKSEEYVKEHMLGDWTECYLPLADLHIERVNAIQNIDAFDTGKRYENAKIDRISDYMRRLNLADATYEEHYCFDGSRFQKEVWTSLKHHMLAVKLESEIENLDIDIHLSSQVKYESIHSRKENELEYSLQAPIYAAPNYFPVSEPIRYEEGRGITAGLLLKVFYDKGSIVKESERIKVRNAKSVYILLCGETNFNTEENIEKVLQNRMSSFVDINSREKDWYSFQKQEHIQCFQGYFNRMDLQLGRKDKEEARKSPVDYLRALHKSGNHQEVYELMFHYARYLMISSSTPNSECANLQGIWNECLRAPWSSNYTVNINTQMNYWFVETANLSDCHLPLFDLLERAVEKGKECAKKIYGLDGFVTHHNLDIWGHATPVGQDAKDNIPSQYSVWPMSGGWLCRHLWEHFLHTNDFDFLRNRAFPIILEAVRFYLGYLVERDGMLHTIPSTSPENVFLNPQRIPNEYPTAAMTMSCVMDISILRELFANYEKICTLLDITPIQDMKKVLKKLPLPQVGRYGQLQEWFIDYEESDICHRHVSHLYGLYPAQEFAKSKELSEAARVTLLRRGKEGTGWCIAWKACLYARLRDGEMALELLNNQLRLTTEEKISTVGGGTYPNLFCAHPPFQIDGNFGFAAAVLEMLVQSEEGCIHVLPAIPRAWDFGEVRGIKVRGGHEVDFMWENHKVLSLRIVGGRTENLYLHFNDEIRKIFIREQEVICILE